MEKTEITLEYTEQTPALGKMILPKKEPKKPFPWKALAKGGCFCLVGLLWGRVEFLGLLRPMGLAYLSAFFGEGGLFWAVWLSVGLGSFPNAPLKAGAGLAAAFAIQLTMGRFLLREEIGKKALLGTFASALAGIFFAISRQGLGFYFAIAAVEGALTLGISYLLQKGTVLLLEREKYFTLTREETLSLLLLLGGALAGLASLQHPLLRDTLLPAASAFFLLFAARQEGIGGGAAAGVFLGFLLFLCNGVELPLFVALALGGMLAGCVSGLGRLASALALVLAPCIFLFYIDMTLLEPIWMGGLVIGAALFSLFPKGLLEKLSGIRKTESPQDRYTKMKELTEEKLLDVSAAFEALAKTFVKEGERKDKGEIGRLVDTIAGRACQDCGLAHYCWEEDLYKTYSMTFSALSHCDSRGRFTEAELPETFRETCPRVDGFVKTVNEVYEMYRRDCLWLSRLTECRELVGQQLQAVGKIMQTLSGQMELNCIFLEGAEGALTDALKKQGFRPKKVVVTEEKNSREGTRGSRQVRIVLPACGGKGTCRDKILPLVKKTLGCPMVLLEEGTCSVDGAERDCTLHFREKPAFSLTTATAFSPAEEGRPTGDAAAFLETERGNALLALSDGMGTGERAAKESRIAIELLEQFTEAGFDRELAVGMINSALLLRRGEETYATLDICHVDLFDGHAEFVKLGAVATYIWRGSRIISLRSATLPAGILKQVSAEKNEMLLKDGDMILMVTDGITDALGGEEQTGAWLKGKLTSFPMSNPQDTAEYILQEAKKERQEGRRDDMTVLASRFWRKRA